MDTKIITAAILLGIFILAPPLGQYLYDIPATLTLIAIIILYLPIYYKLKKNPDS